MFDIDVDLPKSRTKEWKFQRVKLSGDRYHADMPSEWMLVVDSAEMLVDYYLLTHKSVVQDAYEDFRKAHGERPDNPHYTNQYTVAAAMIAELNELSFFNGMNRLFDRVVKNQLEAIRKYGRIYIRSIGSYSSCGEDYLVMDEYVSNEIIYPEEKVRFLQWPGGRHWYAKIGKTDIIVDGEQKWNTKSAAERAAKRFMTETWRAEQ